MNVAGKVLLGMVGVGLVCPVGAEENATALAKAAQNPVANMISVPFQNNTNFDYGPDDDTQNILNIQPVIPVALDPEWNLITRTIAPVITQPGILPGQDATTGLGDIQFTAFLSPAKPHGLIWGVGPIVQLPTNTNDRLGSDRWGLGPSVVALKMDGPWVFGALANNVWSVGGGSDPGYNNFLLQPFVNYNFPEHPGRYLTFSPVITADWKAESGDRWTVPLGLGIGQIVKLGKLPLNLQASVYYNVEKPEYGPDWQLRIQVALLFPK
jgi:hypothetical protein